MTETKTTPELTLYNTLTRRKELFTPADPKRVTMYNCGPTVYSYAHIGNARAAVVADILFRVLRHIYGDDHVVYARNITDVDDKIIEAATKLGVDISEITEKYARIYNEDLAALGCLAPTHQPKATDHIQHMADLIITLMDKDIAYSADDHILFDVTKMEDYGKLSGRKLDDNLAGARVEVASYKRNPGDFVLWKPAKDGEPGWSGQGGVAYHVDWKDYSSHPFALNKGRPGWHIECSAMIKEVLGETIDIHCGGIDLKFPHHENEIAQSQCAHNGAPLANYWVHNEFLNMGNTKMSKSLGNVTLIHDLLEKWDGEVIRLALLKASFVSELNWSVDLLRESKAQLESLYNFVSARQKQIGENYKYDPEILSGGLLHSLYDNLNTPHFLSRLIDWFKSGEGESEALQKFIDEGRSPPGMSDVLSMMINTANLLGLLQKDPEAWFRGQTSDDEKAQIDALVAERTAVKLAAQVAKAAGDKAEMGKQFGRSDEIRDQLKAMNVIVEDGPEGTTWRKG